MKKTILFLLMPVLAVMALSCSQEGGTGEPQITGVTTSYPGNKVVAGKPVTINGSNFSPVASDNKVLYGEGIETVSLRVSEASATAIVFAAPDVEESTLLIRVSVNGKESNSVVLEYDNSLADEDAVSVAALLKNATRTTVVDGVEWISFHGVWEGQMRNINIVKTTLNENNSLGIYFDFYSDDNRNLDYKCELMDAVVGTNGSMGCCHFVRVDGTIKRGANESDSYFVDNAALTIDDGVVDIVRVKSNFDAAKLNNKTVGTGGPMLVYDGLIQRYPEESSAGFLKDTHPRTAIGLSQDCKTVYQVAVDGRWTSDNATKRAIGMETWVLAKLMKGLGCYKAFNFDGGGGTAMWVYGQADGGIVNHPSDSPSWDNKELRPTGSAVYVHSKLKK